ncbi:hypothetical protein EAF00_010093 [Botryotinia globosa]|nr:hypothetical protein EAF00_010093 [Botryotinia globosa]
MNTPNHEDYHLSSSSDYRNIDHRISIQENLRISYHYRPRTQNGCMQPRKYPHKNPLLRLDLFFKMGAAMKTGKVLKTNRELCATYGKPFQSNSLGTPTIHTCESENIKTVLALSFGGFGKVKVKPEKGGGSLEAQGIFVADGKIWQRSRALVRRTFARTEISNFAALDKHVARFLDLLPRDDSTVDLQLLTKNLVW